MNKPILQDEKSAASYLGGERPLSVKTLQAWRLHGYGPAFIRVGRCIRYSQNDLDAFLESQRVTSTSDPGTECGK